MTTALSHSWHHYVAQPFAEPAHIPQNRLHESDGRWEDGKRLGCLVILLHETTHIQCL